LSGTFFGFVEAFGGASRHPTNSRSFPFQRFKGVRYFFGFAKAFGGASPHPTNQRPSAFICGSILFSNDDLDFLDGVVAGFGEGAGH
jgi:hypothetical protein